MVVFLFVGVERWVRTVMSEVFDGAETCLVSWGDEGRVRCSGDEKEGLGMKRGDGKNYTGEW